MFNDVQCEHHWSHDTHQADGPNLAKRVPALHIVNGRTASVIHKSPQKEITWCEIWRNRMV